MVKNITSGQIVNDYLKSVNPQECFIPFNEAMITGEYHTELFSKDFIKERAETHGVSEQQYFDKLKDFLDLLENLDDVNELVLWFGDEDFCRENRKVVLETLKQKKYTGKITLNIINEETYEILNVVEIQ